MNKLNEYVDLKLQFEKYVMGLSDTFNKEFDLVSSSASQTSVVNKIYDYFTQHNFDEHSYRFVYESLKLNNPSLTYKQFIKKYAYRNVSDISSISNNTISDRFSNRVVREIGVLKGRVDRLDNMSKSVNLEGFNSTKGDLLRIINTSTTLENDIRDKIKEQQKILRRNIRGTDYKQAKSKIALLNDQLALIKRDNVSLKKRYNTLDTKAPSMTESKLKTQYQQLLDDTRKMVVDKQQKLVIEQSFQSSVLFPTKTYAQSEFVISTTQNVISDLKDKQDAKGVDVLVKYLLSPSHTIKDICDVHANKDSGYGRGVYLLDKCPHPVTDTHPNCMCRLEEYHA